MKNTINKLFIILLPLLCLSACNKQKPHTHVYGEPVTILEPTSKESGLEIYTCEECGETKEEILLPKNIEYEVVDNSFHVLSSTALEAIRDECYAFVSNIRLPKGTVSTYMDAMLNNDCGIIFAASKDLSSYYSLFMNSDGGNTLNLVKHHNNADEVLDSIYITSAHKPYEAITLKADFVDGDIKCFYNEMMLITYIDETPLKGDKVGFMSKNNGTTFQDIYLSREREFKTVDTLIIGHSFMDLWKNYKTDLSKYPDIANIGIGGSDTNLWLVHLDEILAYRPNRLIYCIGINDFPYPPTYILNNVKTLLEAVIKEIPNIKICVLSVNRSLVHMQYNYLIDQYNALLREYANTNPNIVYGDMDNAYLDENGYPIASCFTDGCHPTEESYKVIASAIYKAFGDE